MAMVFFLAGAVRRWISKQEGGIRVIPLPHLIRSRLELDLQYHLQGTCRAYLV
jgi:hypothetical protein